MAQKARIIYFDVDNLEDVEWEISNLLEDGWKMETAIPHQGIPVPQESASDPNARQIPGGFIIMLG